MPPAGRVPVSSDRACLSELQHRSGPPGATGKIGILGKIGSPYFNWLRGPVKPPRGFTAASELCARWRGSASKGSGVAELAARCRGRRQPMHCRGNKAASLNGLHERRQGRAHKRRQGGRKKKAPGKAVSQGGEGHSLFRERLDAPVPRRGKGGQPSAPRQARTVCPKRAAYFHVSGPLLRGPQEYRRATSPVQARPRGRTGRSPGLLPQQHSLAVRSTHEMRRIWDFFFHVKAGFSRRWAGGAVQLLHWLAGGGKRQ